MQRPPPLCTYPFVPKLWPTILLAHSFCMKCLPAFVSLPSHGNPL